MCRNSIAAFGCGGGPTTPPRRPRPHHHRHPRHHRRLNPNRLRSRPSRSPRWDAESRSPRRARSSWSCSEDIDANPLDLAGRTLMFTPAGSGYSTGGPGPRLGGGSGRRQRMRGPAEVELEILPVSLRGPGVGFFYCTRPGLISFGKPIPTEWGWPARRGTMAQLFERPPSPAISALYKPNLAGNVQVSNLPDRVIVGFFAWDREFTVYGRRPQETFDSQIVLHSDGRIALNYGPQPHDPDEAFMDGIVGVFTIPEATDRFSIALSRPNSRSGRAQYEAVRNTATCPGRASRCLLPSRSLASGVRPIAREFRVAPQHFFGGTTNIPLRSKELAMSDRSTHCQSRHELRTNPSGRRPYIPS